MPSGSGHETSASARRSPRQRKRESSRNKSSTKTRRHTHRPEIREGHRAIQGPSSGAISVPSSRQEPSSRTLKRRLLPDRILRTSSHRSTLAVSMSSRLIRSHLRRVSTRTIRCGSTRASPGHLWIPTSANRPRGPTGGPPAPTRTPSPAPARSELKIATGTRQRFPLPPPPRPYAILV